MLHIVGEDTLLRQTIKRLDGFHPSVNIWMVTVKSLVEDIRFHLQPLEKDAERVHFIRLRRKPCLRAETFMKKENRRWHFGVQARALPMDECVDYVRIIHSLKYCCFGGFR